MTASKELARALRLHALEMVHAANGSHIGSALSAADIVAVLYADILRLDPANPDWKERDRFILSKGHAAALLYAALAERGFFSKEKLKDFAQNGSSLAGHASHHVAGVELSTGSLGHGLGVACGMALAAQQRKEKWRVFALLGDGECNEGSVWEAMAFAAHHKLSNLTAIVDANGLQGFGTTKDVLDLAPLADKGRAFGFDVLEIDGHDHAALKMALNAKSEKPRLIVAATIKGKGVPFMENELVWHYRTPNAEQLAAARAALEASDA
jgi:transketolase